MRILGYRLVVGTVLGLAPAPLAAQIVINEVLADSRLASLDVDGDDSDWVELYNAGPVSIDLAGYALSDDLRQPRKWIFPGATIEPGGYRLIWCSGKDRVQPATSVLEGLTEPIDFEHVLVPLDAEWRYLIGSPDDGAPPAGWNEPGFDDSAWSSGQAGFGFGDDDDETVLPRDIGAVFLRQSFQVDDLTALDNLVLDVCYDDGFVAYINGERVLSANFPADEEPTFGSLAAENIECRAPERFDLSSAREFVQSGANVLAMVLVNRSVTNNDLSLVPQLGVAPTVLHTNFRLSSSGEDLVLTDSSGQTIDQVALPEQTEDHSFGRFPNGLGSFFYSPFPTPLASNDARTAARAIVEEPLFIPPSGKYTEPLAVTLDLDLDLAGAEIHYTLDGTRPTLESSLYTGPILVSEDTVIRAAGYLDGTLITRCASHSYFLSSMAHTFSLPIFSVSMAPDDFEFVHLAQDRRGPLFERPGYLEIMDAGGVRVVGTGFGIRLHGGVGREGDLDTKKAYRAYFRREYGDERLRYRVIPDTEVEEFDKLVLRSNFNDSFRGSGGFIRDQLTRDLHKQMGGTISHGSWYHLFVNMEYRGVYNVVERMDRIFFESHFSDDPAEWDVIKRSRDDEALDGDTAAWNTLGRFFRDNDVVDDATLEEGLELIDNDVFVSYMILNIWARNHDWPQQNWFAARPRRADGRWLFLVWDAELGVSGAETDSFARLFEGSRSRIQDVFMALMRNSHYQQFFLAEMERHLEGVLAPDNVIAHIRRLSARIENDLRFDAALAGRTDTVFRTQVQEMETFARRRPAFLRAMVINSEFLNPRVLEVIPDRVELDGAGPVEVTLRGHSFSEFTKVFFAGVPAPHVELVSVVEMKVQVPFSVGVQGFPAITTSSSRGGTFTAERLLEVVLSETPLRRGDANGDGALNVSDAVAIILAVAGGVGPPSCADALDVDDSGGVDLTDAIALLGYLFGDSGAPPAAPHPGCGVDASPDALGCTTGADCR